jgi:thiol:disulfide interchange protein/DsbC/DsbD-like thiol-disulfide interchange protein
MMMIAIQRRQRLSPTRRNKLLTRLASLASAIALLALAVAPNAVAAPVEQPHILVELLSETETLQPGQDLSVALRLAPQPGWHVYWQNPGETGLPPKLTWSLPEGFAASELQWPHPDRIDTPPYAAFGYKGVAFLPATITTPENLEPGSTVKLTGKANWLVCQTESCVPGRAELELVMQVEGTQPHPDSRWIEQFVEARSRMPLPLDDWKVTAWNTTVDSEPRIIVELIAPEGLDPQFQDVDVFPMSKNLLDYVGPHPVTTVPGGLRINAKPFADLDGPVEHLNAVLVADGAWDFEGKVTAAQISVAVQATTPAGAAAFTVPTPSVGTDAPIAATKPVAPVGAPTAPVASETSVGTTAGMESGTTANANVPITTPLPVAVQSTSLPFALLLAFLGGLILNLMPCVFPVLSLKILGFVQIAHNDASQIRRHGAAFGFGVLVSFWFLAALLLILRAGGLELGWGFQLQSPLFVAAMIFVLFAMALNLLGVFEVGTSLTGVAGRFEGREGYSGSFASGALATVLATPCTAPFMGTALGFALTQPPVASLAVFTSLGVGMAAPYVLLSWFPSTLARLPRPGAWMETFKQAMAFPLLATAVWLIWVFGQQVGNDSVVRLLAALVVMGLAAWMGGRRQFARTSKGSGALGRMAVAVTAALALYLGVSAASFPSTIACAADCDLSAIDQAGPRSWIPYSDKRLADLRSSGRPVFVDFTAAWCLSCKVNETVTFSSDEVWSRIGDLNMAMLKADWTNGSPEITRALERFGRQSVPLYVVYPPGADAQPILLPEIINPSIFLDGLAELG